MFKNFKNYKISKKLWTGFGIVLGLLGVSIVIALIILNTMGSQIKAYSGKTVPNNNHVAEIRRDLVSVQRYMLISLVESDQATIEADLAQASKEAANVAENMAAYKENARVDATKLEELDQMIQDMAPIRKQIQDLITQNSDEGNAQGFKLFMETYKPMIDDAAALMEEFSQTQNELANKQAVIGNQVQIIAYVVLLVAAFVSAVIAFFVIKIIRNAIVTPVIEIEQAAKQLAEGDLSAVITYESKDELGSMATTIALLVDTQKILIQDIGYLLGTMANSDFNVKSDYQDRYVGEYLKILEAMRGIKFNLSNTLRDINEASEQVNAASSQVSSSAQDLANGATDQASSVQELSATITELSDKVRMNAENAKMANNISGEAKSESEQSNIYMQDMVRAMEEIANASKEIEKIINTISDIAEQTNLLSLNAAIEAARAGEAGKGFAVVAGEVGNLAQESAEAVKNTSELIAKTIAAVDNGTKIVDSTAESLKRVIDKTIKVGEKIQSISEASEEQAMSSEQLSQGVDQISMVVQTNAATAEECSAASEELNAQAQMLKDQIGKFTLSEEKM